MTTGVNVLFLEPISFGLTFANPLQLSYRIKEAQSLNTTSKPGKGILRRAGSWLREPRRSQRSPALNSFPNHSTVEITGDQSWRPLPASLAAEQMPRLLRLPRCPGARQMPRLLRGSNTAAGRGLCSLLRLPPQGFVHHPEHSLTSCRQPPIGQNLLQPAAV